MARLRVGIVGCGTAGPAAAILLRRAGHEVTLFERVAEPGPVGAGLLLQPTGMTILHRLGLLSRILNAGARIDFLYGTTPRGRVVMNLGYGEILPGLFGLGIHRGVLFQTLFDAAEAEGTDMRCGVEIVGCAAADGGRTTLQDAEGHSHGPFDLVIAADGARSRLREAAAPVKRARPYDWSALWFIGEDVDRTYRGRLRQVYRGTRRFVGFLPTGRLRAEGPPLVSLFWSIRSRCVPEWRQKGLDPWKREIRRVTSLADPILDQIHDADQVIHARYMDVVLRRPHAGRIVFLGDAAHAQSPQLGQGVNLALVDAAVLVDVLAETGDVAAALPRFAALRKRHNAFYQAASRWLTPLFQSRQVYLGPLRDWFVPWIARIPPFRRQSLFAMVGTKNGWFSSIPIEEVTDYLASS